MSDLFFPILLIQGLPIVSLAGVAVVFKIILDRLVRRKPTIDYVELDYDHGQWFAEFRARFRYLMQGPTLIQKATTKYAPSIIRVPLSGRKNFILPARYADELKSVPYSIMSSGEALSTYLMGDFTGITHHILSLETMSILTTHLSQRLGLLVEPMAEACLVGFAEDAIPDSNDWAPMKAWTAANEVVGRMAARVLVGEELSNNKTWLQLSNKFSDNVLLVSGGLKLYPFWLRPVAALLTPSWWKIGWIRYRARRLLRAEFKKRRAEREEARNNREREKGLDAIDRLMQAGRPDREIVSWLLTMEFGAERNTTNFMTNVLVDLATHWDNYAPELLAEYEEMIKEEGSILRKQSLTKLKKLDSFLKETLRLRPPFALTLIRTLNSDHTLSDGTVLPKSSYISVAAGPLAKSPLYYENPETFDGFRFSRKREQEESGHQFTSTSVSCMMFGHGRFACPGRFYASLVCKIFCLQLLQNYELRLVDGKQRPNDLTFGDAIFPDPSTVIMIRRKPRIAETSAQDCT